jgi:hypothetical protein
MDTRKYRKLVVTGGICRPSRGCPDLERIYVYFWTRAPPRRFRTKLENCTRRFIPPKHLPDKECFLYASYWTVRVLALADFGCRWLRQLCRVTYTEGRIVDWVYWIMTDRGAEIGIALADAQQGLGLGKKLMQVLILSHSQD